MYSAVMNHTVSGLYSEGNVPLYVMYGDFRWMILAIEIWLTFEWKVLKAHLHKVLYKYK